MVRSGLTSFGALVRRQFSEDIFAWLSFACFLAWMFGLYWSSVFSEQIQALHFDFLQLRALWLAIEAITLVGFLIIVLLGKRQSQFGVIVASALTFVGTALVVFFPGGGAIQIAGVVLSGVGSACLLAFSGIRFAQEGAQKLLINVALALIAASLIDGVLLFFPLSLQKMMVPLLPALYMVFFILDLRRRPFLTEKSQKAESVGNRKSILVRVVVLPLIVGVAYGLMQRLSMVSPASLVLDANVMTILSIFISALFIILAALFFESAGLTKLVCFAAIPLIGMAFVLLPLFDNTQQAALSLSIIGFNSFYFMVWALWASNQGELLVKRFVLGLLVLVAAEALGSALGQYVLEAVAISNQTLAVVSLVVVYLLLMASIFSFDRTTVIARESETASQVGIEGGEGSSPGALDLDAWARKYHLSARETQVFELLSKGRNRTYISQALYISDNTTRTHMRNIYRKLNIHSQQELLDLLEEEKRSLRLTFGEGTFGSTSSEGERCEDTRSGSGIE